MGRWLNPGGWLRGCCLGLATLLAALALTALLCGGLLVRRAAAAPVVPLDLLLVVDNSNSLWPLNGPGRDPEGLRLAAARLAVDYLGIDATVLHRVGLIFFGTRAEVVVPGGPLDAAQRARLAMALGQARPAGWTDSAAALRLAATALTGTEAARPVVVLFTDGMPQAEGRMLDELLAELETVGADYEARGVTLSVVLLGAGQVGSDAALEAFWRELAGTTGGRLVVAGSATDLPALYHELVADLLGRTTTTAVEAAPVAATETIARDVRLAAGLEEATIAVWSDTEVAVRLFDPAGQSVGEAQSARSLVSWRLRRPAAGTWRVEITATAPGAVTVWTDVVRAAATATATASLTASATATKTPTPTATTSPTPTRTPTATATPTSLATTTAAPTAMAPPEPDPETGGPGPGGLLCLIPPALFTLGGGWWWRRRQDRRPRLAGRLVELPEGRAIALDDRRDRQTIDPLQLHAALDADGEPATWAAGEGVLVNDRPVMGAQALWDGDLIAVGSRRWRYDNLARRHRS